MIQVIDDCVELDIQEEIFRIAFSPAICLSYSRYTTSQYSKKILRGFTHMFMCPHGSLSNFSNILSTPAITNLPDKEYKRGRLYLQIPSSVSTQGEFHVDYHHENISMVYYVNTTDGDTVFSSIKDTDFPDDLSSEERFDYVNKNSTIVKRVTPKQGRCVIFDGSIYHASSSPTIDDRIILNYNFAP